MESRVQMTDPRSSVPLVPLYRCTAVPNPVAYSFVHTLLRFASPREMVSRSNVVFWLYQRPIFDTFAAQLGALGG